MAGELMADEDSRTTAEPATYTPVVDDPGVAAAEVDAPTSDQHPGDDPVADAVRRWRRLAIGGAAIGVLGTALAIVLFATTAGPRAMAATQAEVLEAGEIIALRVTTFDGGDIDAWVSDTQALATGEYAAEVARLFEPEFRASLAQAQVVSVGEVIDSFVQRIDGDDSLVFAVVRQTYTSALQPTAISDELRMEIAMERIDGAWLASEVQVLGPSTITPIDPAGAEGADDGQ